MVDDSMAIEDDPGEYAEPLAWVHAHGEELARYAGEWVAFASGRIIAHAASLSAVMDQARALGVEDPFLVPVPPDGILTA